jgi:hypothetical protein
MKAHWKRIIFQVVVTLAAIEIVLRIFGVNATYSERTRGCYVSYYGQVLPTWYHVWTPNTPIVYDQPEIKCSYPGNSLGLREVEIPVAKRDSIKRLIFIGDSFTEGDGVEYPFSMPRVFAKKIDSAQLKFEVFNAGVSGSDPFYEYVLLRDKLLTLHPDAVAVCINNSDIQDYIFRGGMERFHKDGTTAFRQGPWWKKLYQFSRIARVVLVAKGYNDCFLQPKEMEAEQKNAVQQILQCLHQMNDLCVSKKIRLICVLHPVPNSFAEGVKQDNIEALTLQAYRDSLPFLDLYPDFRAALNSGNYRQYSWEINRHYNRAGYELYAGILFNEVSKNYPSFLQ